ncbi:adenylate/guanylate cyclase domain-containing protein [Mycolicibacterium fortuitum]|uniref:adenylate/guanylate cyclase domain-containing protein n=1 Tax=Mycolicibacterium fortuitum TaxID=1766 RepID=UPI0007EAFAA5|nr:adenylate/guanylate cyclase domain-containing protein [Mycolicibacterium fortuitum]OBB01524.1 cyclase [Mycolicibacterium fortuitum]OBI63132.1 cyclase [Mycolicibacterium fortuitum]UBV13868.1 adenylate/guanylate cyclase domain-containing protein [Mycolicibacterium fortuitum]
MGAIRLSVSYAARQIYAQTTAAAAVTLVVLTLSRNTVGDARELLTQANLVALIALMIAAAIVDTIVGWVNVHPTFKWFAAGEVPTPQQQRAAMRIAPRQTIIQFTTWAVSALVYTLLNLDAGGGVAYVMGGAILFGGVAAACMGFLVTQRMLRPIVAASLTASSATMVRMPGVLARLITIWTLFSGLPLAGIALIVLARSNGWFVQKTAPVEAAVLVLAVISLVFGLRSMVLVARSVSDPVGEVVLAMKAVERGWSGVSVKVYESSEIGRLQYGFNRMLAGLAERNRLRDLFGRYVGVDVARHALEQGGAVTGDVREAAVLYVDLVGSTALGASRPPQEVAQLLNGFFKIVVDTVERHHGLINKFEGDAVLAVFGAPLRLDNPASSALATARALVPRLHQLPDVEFGVGISCGSVFAGNIGAENRYEYTVIGDAVNEAARLADHAKDRETTVLCSGSALAHADADEGRHWAVRGSTVLRGRSTATVFAEPFTRSG